MIHTTIRAVRFGNIILLLALLCGPLAASGADEKLAEAEKLYLAGDNEKALAAYSAVLTAGDADKLNTAFFYNAGTVAAKANASGVAYVYFLKALSEKFWDGDTLHNLQLTESKLAPQVRAVRPASWISSWPLAAHFIPGLIWFIPALMSSAVFLWVLGSANRRNLAWVWGAAFFLCLMLGIAGYTQAAGAVSGFVKQGQVKSGPGATYSNIVVLDAGALVNVEELREGWMKIRFVGADLQESVGWIEAGALLSLR